MPSPSSQDGAAAAATSTAVPNRRIRPQDSTSAPHPSRALVPTRAPRTPDFAQPGSARPSHCDQADFPCSMPSAVATRATANAVQTQPAGTAPGVEYPRVVAATTSPYTPAVVSTATAS